MLGEIMLIVKHTVETTAPPKAVWNVWQDVKNYNTWDNVTSYCSLDGPFKEGTTGVWKPKGGPALQVKLTRVEPLKVYTAEFKLFLARIISSHYLAESHGKTQVTQQIEIVGPLAFFFAYHLGHALKKDLSREMEALVKKAEPVSKTSVNA
jgi:hypothetical protein